MTSSELPHPHTSGHWEEEQGRASRAKTEPWVLSGWPSSLRQNGCHDISLWLLFAFFWLVMRVKTLFPTLSAFGMSSFENCLFRYLANIWLSISACFFLADFGDLCHRYSEYLLSFWEWEATPGCTLTLLARKYRQGAGVGEVTEETDGWKQMCLRKTNPPVVYGAD